MSDALLDEDPVLNEIKDALIPDLINLVVEYYPPLISTERARSTKLWLCGTQWYDIASTLHHPDDLANRSTCQWHHRTNVYCGEDDPYSYSHCAVCRHYDCCRSRLSPSIDVLGEWNERLSKYHRCNTCRRLIACFGRGKCTQCIWPYFSKVCQGCLHLTALSGSSQLLGKNTRERKHLRLFHEKLMSQ
jgi:hypothetical protein